MAIVIRFTVGDADFPQDGASFYYNPNLLGNQIQVFREGNYQYPFGSYRIVRTGTGSIFFIPALQGGERILIHKL